MHTLVQPPTHKPGLSIIRKSCLIFMITLVAMITGPGYAVAQNNDEQDENNDLPADTLSIDALIPAPSPPTDETLRLIRAMRSDISELKEENRDLNEQTRRRINDRLGALDQRLITIENRTNQIYTDIRGVDNSFAVGIGFMIGIAVLTIAMVYIQRRKFVDPLRIQIARIEAELENSDDAKSERIRNALRELAENDPRMAQLLHKYDLDK